MVRNVAGFLLGGIAWVVGFFILVTLLTLIWPDYATQARAWQSQRVFGFTTLMAVLMLLFWALAAMGAGWVAMKVAKHPVAVWVLAGCVELYIMMIHLALAWSVFPWWYNLGVVIPAVPAMLLGAKLARPAATAAA